ncbi:MAG: DUF1801 domain-containing protein [Spirochaetes bacterium]|nr:DUF1801 domain-containing protein [Spirochaetota bacterium]
MASHDITFLDADEGKKETGIPPIDRYIQGFPRRTQALLKEMRRIIRSVAPDAAEKISYQMPTFHLHGNLVHFAGYERHIGFYPTSSGISAFESELGPYKHAKGSVQFPIEEPLPADLIMRITRFRLEENMRNASTAKWKKKSGT